MIHPWSKHSLRNYDSLLLRYNWLSGADETADLFAESFGFGFDQFKYLYRVD